MPRKRADPDVVALLQEWLAAAKSGELQDVFLVGRQADGEYADAYVVADLEEMLYEVRSAWIRARNHLAREPATH